MTIINNGWIAEIAVKINIVARIKFSGNLKNLFIIGYYSCTKRYSSF
jgi:hypothetical protein